MTAQKMNKFEVNTSNFSDSISKIIKLVRPNKRYLITIKEWDSRSLPANAVVHVWIKQISEHTGESIKTVEARCKRDHGLPIALSGENGQVLAWMLEQCHFNRLDDSQQLKLVSAMEVSRNFTTKEHNDYRDSIQHFWNDNGLMLSYKN